MIDLGRVPSAQPMMSDKPGMDAKIDMKLYNQVKAKFAPVHGAMTFISLTSANVDELVPQSFRENEMTAYFKLIDHHKKNSLAYAVVDYDGGIPNFFLCCKEFMRHEESDTGRILFFRIEPYAGNDVDMEKVREDLKKLAILLNDPKAS